VGVPHCFFDNKYTGKTLREYEWTLLKKLILNELNFLDKSFKKEIRKKKRQDGLE